MTDAVINTAMSIRTDFFIGSPFLFIVSGMDVPGCLDSRI
jgi:hypothetical protein